MSDDGSGTPISRRTVLGLLGAATGLGTAGAELAPEDGQGSLTGGTMSLNQAYNVAEGLWIGPDSARSNVDAKSGRVYIGASGDGYTLYNGDNGTWDTKGLGDGSNPIPSATIDDATVNTSFTDPAGVKHTGELADLSDTGGSGTSLTVEDDGSQLVSGADLLDFAGNDFDVSNPTGSDAAVTLTNDSVTVAGNTVALGGSTGIAPSDLSALVSGDDLDLADIAGTNITVDATNSELDASSGGTDVEIADDGTTVVNPTDRIDFQGGDFEITNPAGSEAAVTLTNDSLTVSGGNGIKSGGTVALGGTLTLDVEPADIAGDNLTVDTNNNELDAAAGGVTQVATGTVTATGGSSPAVNTTLTGVSTDQDLDYWFTVYVDSDPAFNADYAWNYDYYHQWDDSQSEFDIDLVVNWDVDPGNGNDVTLRWEVLQ